MGGTSHVGGTNNVGGASQGGGANHGSVASHGGGSGHGGIDSHGGRAGYMSGASGGLTTAGNVVVLPNGMSIHIKGEWRSLRVVTSGSQF